MHPVIWLALGVLMVAVGLAAVFWRDIPEGECEEVYGDGKVEGSRD